MKPADVNKSNKDQVWITLYGYIQGDFPIPKFKVGDTVRVSKYKNIFNKGYEANFTEEIFKIAKVFRGDPNMYELVEASGSEPEPIMGKFYEEELSAVNKTDDVVIIPCPTYTNMRHAQLFITRIPSYTVIYRHIPPYTVIYCRTQSYTVIYSHLVSSTVMYCHVVSSRVIHCHLVSSNVIHCHLVLSTVI